jgi:hypothetical protein
MAPEQLAVLLTVLLLLTAMLAYMLTHPTVEKAPPVEPQWLKSVNSLDGFAFAGKNIVITHNIVVGEWKPIKEVTNDR